MYHMIYKGEDVSSGTPEDMAWEFERYCLRADQATVENYAVDRAREDPDWAEAFIRSAIRGEAPGFGDLLIDMIEEAGMMEVPLILSDELRVEWMDDEGGEE